MCAYSDLLGIDEALAYGMAEAFGTGIGGMQGTCGAVLAMYMAVGLKNSDGLPAGRATRGETYKIVRELNQKFKAKKWFDHLQGAERQSGPNETALLSRMRRGCRRGFWKNGYAQKKMHRVVVYDRCKKV